MELMKKEKDGEISPVEIPDAIRIICPYCKKKFHTHLLHGTVVTWCKRCRRLIKTSREEVSPTAIPHLFSAVNPDFVCVPRHNSSSVSLKPSSP